MIVLAAFIIAAALLFIYVDERHQRNQQHKNLMTGLENLTAAVQENTEANTKLTASVDAAVVELNKEDATEAQLNTLAEAVRANATGVSAQAKRLDDAITPPGN